MHHRTWKRIARGCCMLLLMASSGCSIRCWGSREGTAQSAGASKERLQCCSRESRPSLIRTGGALRQPRRFQVVDGETLTLREAILESGGLIQSPPGTPQTIVAHEVIATQLPPQIVAQPASGDSQTTATNPFDLGPLRSVFANVDAMHALFESDPNFSRYAAPTGEGLVGYLRSALNAIESITAFNGVDTRLDPATIDTSSDDPGVLLAGLRQWFEVYRTLNVDFADTALIALQDLEATLAGSYQPVRAAPISRPVNVVVSPTHATPILIGLKPANSEEDVQYFHPALVMRSVIGNMQLKDGDFLFAVPAEQTSLLVEKIYRHEHNVPALGLQQGQIDPTLEPNLVQALEHRVSELRGGQRSIELDEVGIVRRTALGGDVSENFYLPLPGALPANDYILDELGTVRPGDIFMFTSASKTPFVIARTIDPIRARLEAKRAAMQSAIPAVEKARQKPIIAKVRADVEYYTRPLAQRAKNLLR